MLLAFGGNDGPALSFVFGLVLAGALLALILAWGATIITGLICLPAGRRWLPIGLGLVLATGAFGLLCWLELTSRSSGDLMSIFLTLTTLPAAAGVLPIGFSWHRLRTRHP